jgi:hypothetical protein
MDREWFSAQIALPLQLLLLLVFRRTLNLTASKLTHVELALWSLVDSQTATGVAAGRAIWVAAVAT